MLFELRQRIMPETDMWSPNTNRSETQDVTGYVRGWQDVGV